MAKRDILKTYSIEIATITEKASAQINQLEKELDTLAKNKGMNTGLQSQIDSMTESLNGLKGEVKASSKQINESLGKINTDKMAEQFKQMDESIAKSISDVQKKMTELQDSIEFLSNPNNTKGLTTGFSKAFGELENTINGVLTKFTDVSTVMQGILDGSINTSNIQKDFQKVEDETKNLKKYLNDLYRFMGNNKISFTDKKSLKQQSEVTLREFRVLMDTIVKEANSLDNTAVVQNLISKKLGIGTKDLKSYIDGADKVLNTLNEKLGGKSGVEVSLTYRIAENDENAINGIVKQIKQKVIDKVQEKLDSTPIKIPIGYTYDKAIMESNQKDLDAAEGKDVDKVLFKHINLKVKGNTSDLVKEINKEVTRVNQELRKSGNKIEIEAVAKLNPATIAQTSKEIAEDVEDAQFNYVNGGIFKGGKLTIDQIDGLATENTLKDIRNIISQWNSTGIPGTQSKEFQEQVKVEQETQKYYSDFNKRLHLKRQSGVLNKTEYDKAITRDQLIATLRLEDVAREEINKLVRNTKFKTGEKSVLTESDFYTKSYKVDGVEYATFGDGETLSAWQAKWDAIFENTFVTAENYNKNLGRLFDLTEKTDDGKTKILEKGQLKLRREAINKRQKSRRESLSLLGVEFGKNEKGVYNHDYILDERHTVTSLEDAYAKTKTVVGEIKNMAQQEYDIRMQEINGLKQQREIMLEIHDLEEKSKAGTINVEELDRLEVLRNELSNQVRIISDTEKYDSLISEKNTLANKIKNNESLSKNEHKRWMEIDGDIESLFVKVDDLSEFTTKQITATTENGLSPIDKQIQYLEGQVKDFVKKVRSDISLVFKPVAEETIEKTASDKKNKKTDRVFSRDNIKRYRLDVPITSDEKYEWNKKTISKLYSENGRLGKLIQSDPNTSKRDFSLLTQYEKSKFFQNEKIIKALQAQNHLYEEQKGLLDNLHTGYQHLEKDYSSTARTLELSGTNEEKHNQIIKAQAKANLDAKEKGQTNVTEKSFIHDLNDSSLKEVNEVYKNLQSNIESQAGLTSTQIRGLVESQIQEDIDFFKAELKDTEKTILDMEKNPDKYSAKQKKDAEYKQKTLESSITALEDKTGISNQQLLEQREILKGLDEDRDKYINRLKTSVALNEEEIEEAVKLLALKKQQAEAEKELSNANISAYNYYKNQQKNPRKESETVYSTENKNTSMYSFGEYTEKFGDNVLEKVKQLNTINHELKEHESSLKVLNPELLRIMNEGVQLTEAELNHWYEIEEKREAVVDKILGLKARQKGMTKKQYRTDVLGVSSVGGMKIGTGIGGSQFDPYDDSGEEINLYQERVNFYTEEMMKKDANREKFVRDMLKLTEDELALREENRKKHETQIQAAKESFEIEKKSLKERQKNTSFTDKAYKAKKAEIESIYEQQKAEQELLKIQKQKEKDLLQAEPKRAKNGKIYKNDTSINARISRIIENVTNKEEYALSLAMQKESEIIEARNKRIANITTKRSELQAYQDDAEWARISPKLKALERLDGESDLEYNKRSDLTNRRQSLILSKQEAINNAEKEHNQLLKEENAELDKINKKKDKLLSSVQVDTSLTKDTISSLTNSYLEKEKTYLALKKESSLVGTTGTDKIYSDEEKKELQSQLENAAKEFQNIKQQFIKEFLSYVANSTADDLDKQSSIIYQNIMNEKMMSEQSEAYSLMAKRNAEIAGKDTEISLIENRIKALDEERIVSLQNLEVQKEIRNFEKGMSAKQKSASFAVDSKLLEIQELKNKLSSSRIIQKDSEEYKAIKTEIKSLEKERESLNPNIKTYQLHYDHLSNQINNLKDKLDPNLFKKNTEEFKRITQQIAEAKLHLQWFREEAEKVGLTLSETTGRMYLDSTKKDAAITGLTYKGLARKSGEGSSADYKDSIELSKRLQAERLKEFHRHSKVVDEVKEESRERQRIFEMWRIAGMNDREAELAYEIRTVNAQLKKRKDLTKEQKQDLQEQYEQLKKTIELENKAGKTNITFGEGGYIKEKVGYEEFVNNQAQFATNKILQRMMNSPTSSMSDVINSKAPIENYRLATESTLQNIVKILLQGVKVKLVGKKYQIDHSSKRFGGLNPMLNPDADAINPVIGDWYKPKDKKAKDKEKKILSRKDYNRLISKSKTEEEKNKYRTQALQSGGYFALNDKGNIVSLGSGKYRKDNKNRTDQNIINATKKYIEEQKLAIKVEEIFAETVKKSEKAIENKSKATEKSTKNTNGKTSTKKEPDESKINATTTAIKKQTEKIKENTNKRQENNQTPVATQSDSKSKNTKFYGEDGALKVLSKEELNNLSKEELTEYIDLSNKFLEVRSKLLKDNDLLGFDNKNKYKNKDLLPQLSDIKKRYDFVNEQLSSKELPTLSPEDVLGDRPNLLKEFEKLEKEYIQEAEQVFDLGIEDLKKRVLIQTDDMPIGSGIEWTTVDWKLFKEKGLIDEAGDIYEEAVTTYMTEDEFRTALANLYLNGKKADSSIITKPDNKSSVQAEKEYIQEAEQILDQGIEDLKKQVLVYENGEIGVNRKLFEDKGLLDQANSLYIGELFNNTDENDIRDALANLYNGKNLINDNEQEYSMLYDYFKKYSPNSSDKAILEKIEITKNEIIKRLLAGIPLSPDTFGGSPSGITERDLDYFDAIVPELEKLGYNIGTIHWNPDNYAITSKATPNNNAAKTAEEMKKRLFGAKQEIKEAEQKSGETTVQEENKKKKAVDATTEAYVTQGKTIKKLISDYSKSLRYKDSDNKDTSKKWTDIYKNTSKELTKNGYQLVDGKWIDKKSKKDSPDPTKSQQKILDMDFDSMSYKQLKSKRSWALNHMDNAAWKTVLPIVEQKIKDIDDETEKYFKSFANELEFVQDVLRKNKIDYEGDFNIKEISRNGNTFYKFENDKTSGRIYKSNEDGKWHVDAVKNVVETRKQVKALKKDLSKLDVYKFDLLESADPDMFYNSKEIAEAKESLIELRNLKPENFIGIKQDEIDSIKDKIKSVIDVATELRGNLRVGETEILGTIDKTSIDTVRQQMVALAKNTSVGTVEIEKFNAKNNELVYTVRTADDMLQTYTISMNKMNGELSKTLVSETEYVSGFRRAVSALGSKFGELIRYTVASISIYDTFRVIKQGVNVVKEMDVAMTELRKVSKDTESALQSFRKESYKIAADIASTGKEIVNSAADWQKLGYSIEEASELAKNSALYSNVGDMEIGVATEHMVSTLKAFNIEAKDSIQIVDKANEVGNNFAITSAGIGEALERSASSLVAAGNDIDQSIALITAGNIITQDPESVGNAIKVLSLRIRGSKTELEEMGEETDNLAESSSKLRSELKALTGVDIMLNDKEYKSTYQILLEISKVWDSLSDVSQANTLEKLAGKTRASVVAGLLQNGETMEEVYQTSINSAGSAMEENARYAQSIQGHLDLLTNKWQEMWDSAINSDIINFFIDLGTGALDLVDKIGLIKSAIGAISIGLGAFTSFKNVGINTLVAY